MVFGKKQRRDRDRSVAVTQDRPDAGVRGGSCDLLFLARASETSHAHFMRAEHDVILPVLPKKIAEVSHARIVDPKSRSCLLPRRASKHPSVGRADREHHLCGKYMSQQQVDDARERARRAAQAALQSQCERNIMRKEMSMLECYQDAWARYALGIEERSREQAAAAGGGPSMGGGARPYPLPPSSPRAIDQMRTKDAEERILAIAERLTASLGPEAWQFHAQRAGELANVPLHWLRQIDEGVEQLQRAAQDEPTLRRELASQRVRADAAEELAAQLEQRNEERDRYREQERQRERAELEEALVAGDEREKALRLRIRELKQRLTAAHDDVEASASDDEGGSGSDEGVVAAGGGGPRGGGGGGGAQAAEEEDEYLPFDGGAAAAGDEAGSDALSKEAAVSGPGVSGPGASPSWWSRMMSRSGSSGSSSCQGSGAAAAVVDADAAGDGPPESAAEVDLAEEEEESAAEEEEAADKASLLDSSSSRAP